MYKHFKVYVGCSLTHAPAEFKQLVEQFKGKLSEVCTVMCFLGCGTGATPNEVYQYDIHECVYKCDLMVGVCDLWATGLGYEIATQVEARRKPFLGLAHREATVTHLILDTRQPGFIFQRYEVLLEDGVEKVKEVLARMQAESTNGTLFSEPATDTRETVAA